MDSDILVVDDSAAIRKILTRVLRQTGMAIQTIHEAGGGQEALAVMALHRVDLVLSDINMPKMDGLHVGDFGDGVEYVFVDGWGLGHEHGGADTAGHGSRAAQAASVKTDLEAELGPLGLSIPTVVFGRNFKTRSAAAAEWIHVRFLWDADPLRIKMCLALSEKTHAVHHGAVQACALEV